VYDSIAMQTNENQSAPPKRLSVMIDAALHKELKKRALEQDVPMGEAVNRILRVAFQQEMSRSTQS
jgi:hypothetical protein